jgi:hypothetical protein
MIKNFNILATILLILAMISSISLAGQDENIDYKFNITDSSYSFYGSFKIRADVTCLLEITFNYDHLRAMVPDAKEVILLDQGINYNKIKYIFQKYLLFVNTSVWNRVLDAPGQRVEFTLVSSENNLSIMPQLISSRGYYQIIQQDGYQMMEYYHECRVTEKTITKLYLNQLKDEAIGFIYLFSEYACEYCNCSPFKHNE